MNLFGFQADFLPFCTKHVVKFKKRFRKDESIECWLPAAVSAFMKQKKKKIAVLPVSAKWYGLTYPDDEKIVRTALTRSKK